MTYHTTKRAAIAEITGQGYVNGDHKDDDSAYRCGSGSRAYFMRRDGGFNEYGIPLIKATVTRVGGQWATSYFGGK